MPDDSAYAEEQDRLARELQDGDIAASALRGEVEKAMAKEPVVDPKVYEGVESMLFRGFLLSPARLADVPFVFKSLNHHEFQRIDWYYPKDRQHYNNIFLAHCVFAVDGENVLPERASHISKLITFFEALPDLARNKLVRQLSELNRKAANAIALTEAYVMESYSRFRWAQLRGLDLMSIAVTGIEGTDKLGLNWGQLAWRALNFYEDTKDDHERDWDNAKFIGGCMAGKGIQKVYNQDKQRRKGEHEERLARKDRVLRKVLLGEREDAAKKAGIAVRGAQTVDDLVEQLEGDLKGEKDWHDQIVASAEEKIRQRYQGRQRQIQEMAAESDEKFGDQNVIGGTDFSGLTPEQAKRAVEQRRIQQAQVLAAVEQQMPELMDPRYDRFAEKWGTYEGGDLADRDPSDALPVGGRAGGTPFRRKK